MDSKECQEQIAFADVILLNKVDLVSEQELDALERTIRSMNAMARIHRTRNAEIDLDQVLDVGGFDLTRALDTRPAFLEPEYPFEWSGVYRLGKGEHVLTLQDGSPDPSMDVLLLPISNTREEGLIAARAEAVSLISERRSNPATGGYLLPGVLHRIDLKRERVWHKVVTERFVVVLRHTVILDKLYPEHLPSEFAMRILRGDGEAVEPLSVHQYNPGHAHDNTVTSVSIVADGDLDEKKLNQWVSKTLMEQGTNIFRMKGIVSIADQDRRFVFQGVHMLFDGEPERPWGREKRSNQLVFIGRDLDATALNEGFRACLR